MGRKERELSQSTFCVADGLPELVMDEIHFSVVKRVALSMLLTLANFATALGICLVYKKCGPTAWHIIVQIPIMALALREPVAAAVEIACMRMQSRVGSALFPVLHLEVLCATFLRLETMAMYMCMVVAAAVLLPAQRLTSWSVSPWTYILSNIITVMAAYSAMNWLASVVVCILRYRYCRQEGGAIIEQSQVDVLSLFVLGKAIQTAPEEGAGWRAWIAKVFAWGKPPFGFVLKRRARSLAKQIEDVDLERLAGEVWAHFFNKSSESGVEWGSYFRSIVGKQYASQSILSSVQDAQQLLEHFRTIAESCSNRADEIAGQDKVFRQLHQFFSAVALVLIVLVVLPMLGFGPNERLLPLGVSITPTLIALSVIFRQSVNRVVNSILFVLMLHPFDIGDEIRIEREFYLVKKMGLLFTTLENLHGIVLYYPNNVLSQLSCVNVTRSTRNWHHIEVVLPFATENDKIHRLSHDLRAFTSRHPADYKGIRIHLYNSHNCQGLRLAIQVEQRVSRDLVVNRTRRQKALTELLHRLQQLDLRPISCVTTLKFT